MFEKLLVIVMTAVIFFMFGYARREYRDRPVREAKWLFENLVNRIVSYGQNSDIVAEYVKANSGNTEFYRIAKKIIGLEDPPPYGPAPTEKFSEK